jgi:succinate-semialdehyde dehydrogenase/glutarate-semialdehyde dehydrogenase
MLDSLCVSTERMYVADAIYDRFKEKFVAAVKAMTLRPGLDWGNDMGTLTGPSQLEAVTKHVEDAKAKGATVLAGGGHARTWAPTSTSPPSWRASTRR